MKKKRPQNISFALTLKFYNFIGRKLKLKSAIFRSDIPRKEKIKRLIFAYSAFGVILTMLFFTTAYLVDRNWGMASFVIFCASFYFYILFFGFRKFRNTENLILINSTLMGILLLCVLIKSAPDGYVALWLYIFPIFLYLIQNMKHAMTLNFIFLLGILAIVSAQDFIPWGIRFENGFRFRFPITIAMVMMVAFMIELIRSRYEQRMTRQQKKLEKEKEKLAMAKNVVEQTSRAKSDFLANMSHELRTPLNHIIGFTELVAEKGVGELNNIQEEYLKDALQSAKNLFNLINDTLDLAKADSGRMDFQASMADIRNLVESCVETISEDADKKKIRLTSEFSNIPELIPVDMFKIKKVLNNILSNAIKYTPDGGEVQISTGIAKNEKLLELGLQASPKDTFIEISVKDNGVGIREEDLERILNPFEQVEAGISRRYSGTGVGLALARRLVALHHGIIWAKSEGLGKGADFHVVLPVGSA